MNTLTSIRRDIYQDANVDNKLDILEKKAQGENSGAISEDISQVKSHINKKFLAFCSQYKAQEGTHMDIASLQNFAQSTIAGDDFDEMLLQTSTTEWYKIYRSEMTRQIVDFLDKETKKNPASISPNNASKIMERALNMVSYEQIDLGQSLADAAYCVKGVTLSDASIRAQYEQKMKEGKNITFNEYGHFAFGGKNYQPKQFLCLIGAGMTPIKNTLLSNFCVQNAVMIDGKIWGIMQNGCQGNLVIIDPQEQILNKNIENIATNERKGQYIADDTKSAWLIPSAAQFDRELSPQAMSKQMLSLYKTNLSSFVSSITSLPKEKQEETLSYIFKEITPAERAHMLNNLIDYKKDIQDGKIDALDMQGLEKKLQEEIEKKLKETVSKPSENAYWQVQSLLLLISKSNNGSEKGQLFEQIALAKNKVIVAELPAELRDSFTKQIGAINLNFKQNIALDMVNSMAGGLSTAFANEKEQQSGMFSKTLKELSSLSAADIAKELSSGIDTDAEVFLSSSHVLEALRICIMYAYPQDIANGVNIANPIRYYLEQIKTNDYIAVLPNAQDTFYDCIWDSHIPLINGVFDTTALFVDKKKEIALFEEYSKGEESVGQKSWNQQVGLTRRDYKALFSQEGGILAKSDALLDKDFSEISSQEVENLELIKIKKLVGLGHYDEARAIIVEQLQDKLAPMDEAYLSAKTQEISAKWSTKLKAQIKLQLTAQGQDASDEVISLQLEKILKEKTAIKIREEQLVHMVASDSSLQNVGGFMSQEPTAYEKELIRIENSIASDNWLSPENLDMAEDITKMVAEIVVIQVATAGVGGLAMGALRAGTSAVRTTDAFATANRAFGLGQNVFTGAFRSGLGVSGMAGGNMTRLAGQISSGTGGFGAARLAQLGLNSSAFVLGQKALNSDLVDMSASQFWTETALTMVTLGVLGKTQQYMRGQTGLLGSSTIGNWSENLARTNMAGKATVAAGEIATETSVMMGLSASEIAVQKQLGMLSQDQINAMSEPDGWREWAHTMGVVAGLRTWRSNVLEGKYLPPIKETPIRTIGDIIDVKPMVDTIEKRKIQLLDAVKQLELLEQGKSPKQLWISELAREGEYIDPKKAQATKVIGDIIDVEHTVISGDITARKAQLLAEIKQIEQIQANKQLWIVDRAHEGEYFPPKSAEGVKTIGDIIDVEHTIMSDSIEMRKPQISGIKQIQEGVFQNRTNTLERINIQDISRDTFSDNAQKLLSEGDIPKPEYKVMIDEKEFLFTNKIRSGARTYILGYVLEWGKYEPRLFYYSKSGGNWHCAVGVEKDGRFSKGEFLNASYEKGTVAAPELSEKFQQFSEVSLDQDINATWRDKVGVLNEADFKEKYENEFDIKHFLVKKYEKENLFVNSLFNIPKTASKQEVKDLFKTMNVENLFDLNFSGGFTKWGTQVHKYLGEVELTIGETTLKGEKVQVIFAQARNNPELVWVENIAYTDNAVNSYGILEKNINAGLLTTKPLEYETQIPDALQWGKKYDNSYVDVREYIQDNPLIVAFKQAQKS